MGDPVSGAILGSTVLQSYGAYYEGQANAQIAEYNAQIAEQNKQASLAQSKEDERRLRMSNLKQIGAIRAGYAASGVQLEGSAMDVLEESASLAELDALSARYQGEMRARDYDIEANLERYRAKTSKTLSYFVAGGLLLSGGSRYAAYNNKNSSGGNDNKPKRSGGGSD